MDCSANKSGGISPDNSLMYGLVIYWFLAYGPAIIYFANMSKVSLAKIAAMTFATYPTDCEWIAFSV